jgi:hypothetical protein
VGKICLETYPETHCSSIRYAFAKDGFATRCLEHQILVGTTKSKMHKPLRSHQPSAATNSNMALKQPYEP